MKKIFIIVACITIFLGLIGVAKFVIDLFLLRIIQGNIYAFISCVLWILLFISVHIVAGLEELNYTKPKKAKKIPKKDLISYKSIDEIPDSPRKLLAVKAAEWWCDELYSGKNKEYGYRPLLSDEKINQFKIGIVQAICKSNETQYLLLTDDCYPRGILGNLAEVLNIPWSYFPKRQMIVDFEKQEVKV